jgi:ABC-type glutathione transport system ATPase component
MSSGCPLARRSASLPEPVLSAGLTVDYPQKPGVLRNLQIDVQPGEILGLAGQSGAGKSTLALALFRLLDHTGARTAGSIVLQGSELLTKSERQMREVRGRLISLVPQSPLSALNPALRIGTQVREVWKAHAKDASALAERLRPLMASAALPDDDQFLRRYPAEISVGQAQRLLIVMALLHNPVLIVADEPASALDVMTQRDVLGLLGRLNRERGTSLLYISHDLPSIRSICHRVAILHDGGIVECGPVDQVFLNPTHAYTRRLVDAVPKWL